MSAVLDHAWDVPTFTATDAMTATGLTRATVLARADDLVRLGWLREVEDHRPPGGATKGRPARHYAFEPRAGYVLGIDAGQHRVTACVADLRGAVLARAERTQRDDEDAASRVAVTRAAVAEALDAVGADDRAVLVTVVGIPAPADDRGRSPAGQDGYWPRMNADLATELAAGRTVVVDNDANLAAIAEGSVGAGVGASSFVALLSGERFGAGLIVDGTLLRGRHGGAGELHLLDLVEDVGSADGLGFVARAWAQEAIDAGDVPPGSLMRRRAPEPAELVDVVEAAQAGEEAAAAIVDRLGERLARVAAVLTGLLDVERVIVAGALAQAAGPIVESAAAKLPAHTHLPVPTLVASTLGADSVTLGAVHRGVAMVRADPLRFKLPELAGVAAHG